MTLLIFLFVILFSGTYGTKQKCDPECDPNAICSISESEFKPTCQCKPDFIMNDVEECIRAYVPTFHRCNKKMEWVKREEPDCEPNESCCCGVCKPTTYCSKIFCGGSCCD